MQHRDPSQTSIRISTKLTNIGVKKSPGKKKDISSPPPAELVSDYDHSARSQRFGGEYDENDNKFNQAKLRSQASGDRNTNLSSESPGKSNCFLELEA